MQLSKTEIKNKLTKLQKSYRSQFGENEKLFMQRIFKDGIEKYVARLEAIGFAGNEKVLDAGCGYGQWSLALSILNKFIEACDISTLRTNFLKNLSKELKISNLNIRQSGISVMPYEQATFDAIFCYGVIFLTDWRKSLTEFARVLKPNGTLYINANGLGWYMFLWQEEHNKAIDYDPKVIAAKSLADTIRYEREKVYEEGMNLIIEPKMLTRELSSLGFKSIELKSEGSIQVNKKSEKPLSFFKGKYKGQTGVYEVLASYKR